MQSIAVKFLIAFCNKWKYFLNIKVQFNFPLLLIGTNSSQYRTAFVGLFSRLSKGYSRKHILPQADEIPFFPAAVCLQQRGSLGRDKHHAWTSQETPSSSAANQREKKWQHWWNCLMAEWPVKTAASQFYLGFNSSTYHHCVLTNPSNDQPPPFPVCEGVSVCEKKSREGEDYTDHHWSLTQSARFFNRCWQCERPHTRRQAAMAADAQCQPPCCCHKSTSWSFISEVVAMLLHLIVFPTSRSVSSAVLRCPSSTGAGAVASAASCKKQLLLFPGSCRYHHVFISSPHISMNMLNAAFFNEILVFIQCIHILKFIGKTWFFNPD